MNPDSPFEKQARALELQNMIIGAAAVAHAVQQNQIIRSVNEQSELIRKQQEWERQRAEAEVKRKQQIIDARRSMLKLADDVAALKDDLNRVNAESSNAIQNRVIQIGFEYKVLVLGNEDALEETADLKSIADLKKELNSLDDKLKSLGLSVEVTTASAEEYFRKFGKCASRLSSYFAAKRFEFAPKSVGLAKQQLKHNAECEARASNAQGFNRELALDGRVKVRITIKALEVEKNRAVSECQKLLKLASDVTQLADGGAELGYFVLDQDQTISDVAEELKAIAYVYCRQFLQIISQLPNLKRANEVVDEQVRAIEAEFSRCITCHNDIAELSKLACEACMEENYAEAAKLFSKIQKVWDNAEFVDIPDFVQARREYGKRHWKWISNLFKSSKNPPAPKHHPNSTPNSKAEAAASPVPQIAASEQELAWRKKQHRYAAIVIAFIVAAYVLLFVVGAIASFLAEQPSAQSGSSPDSQTSAQIAARPNLNVPAAQSEASIREPAVSTQSGTASSPSTATSSLLPALSQQPAVKPSFDCPTASSAVDKMICSDPLLGKLDVAQDSNYKYMSVADIGDDARQDLDASQRRWLLERNECPTRQCLIDSYRRRIDQICEYPVLSGVHPICISSDSVN